MRAHGLTSRRRPAANAHVHRWKYGRKSGSQPVPIGALTPSTDLSHFHTKAFFSTQNDIYIYSFRSQNGPNIAAKFLLCDGSNMQMHIDTYEYAIHPLSNVRSLSHLTSRTLFHRRSSSNSVHTDILIYKTILLKHCYFWCVLENKMQWEECLRRLWLQITIHMGRVFPYI